MQEIQIPIEQTAVGASCTIPKQAKGMVVFAHGSGSSRFSPRNQYVAKVLSQGGLATCLVDLLTPEEEVIDEKTRQYRFDIPMLAHRLVIISKWLKKQDNTKMLRIGYFGASTGAAAALIGASLESDTFAVVSRGGGPDLAQGFLEQVKAPTLLIVGGLDSAVIEMNREAYAQLQCEKKLQIVPHATHLFEEKGALEQVAILALDWFKSHLK
jgi:dienelactone hydrolase